MLDPRNGENRASVAAIWRQNKTMMVNNLFRSTTERGKSSMGLAGGSRLYNRAGIKGSFKMGPSSRVCVVGQRHTGRTAMRLIARCL